MKVKIGEFSGIGVFVHWSFWILPLVIVLSTGGGLAAALPAIAFVFAIFGCVVAHELGHALTARRFGIGTRDITLYPIGGVASLDRIPRRPVQELAIALAGPAVNVAIAAGLGLLIWLVSSGWLPLNSGALSFALQLLWANVGLAVFNLLPAFPMDGGRVLRAFLAMGMPYSSATTIAARVGQILALGLAVAGLFGNGMLIFLGVFVFLAAQAELAAVRMREAAPSHLETPPFPAPRSGGSWVAAGPEQAGIVWVGDLRSHPPRPLEPCVVWVRTNPR